MVLNHSWKASHNEAKDDSNETESECDGCELVFDRAHSIVDHALSEEDSTKKSDARFERYTRS